MKKTKAERQVIVNKLINDLIGPLQEEVKDKNNYRKGILLAFSLYFLLITTMIFITINSFKNNGFTNSEAQITNFLIAGLFVNIVGLALIIFKYLFDENNTFFKGMIDLITKTINYEEKRMTDKKDGN